MKKTRGVRPATGSQPTLTRHVVDSLASGLAVLDRTGNIILTNEAWNQFARENSTGDPPHFGVGLNYLEVCSSASGATAEGAKDIQAGLEEVLSGATDRFSFEYPCHSPTARRWFLLQATRLDSPEGGAVVLHIDITDRKLLEDRLQQQEERFRVALENSPVVVFNQDRDLRYTWINSPVLAWGGQDYMGRTDREIVGGPEGDELMAIKRAVLDSGVGRRVETTVTFEGVTHYFDLTIEPMRDTTGSIQGVTCSATDITSNRENLLERERLIARLQDAVEEVKLLSGLLSMCASCKKITNEKGDWEPLESYLQSHSQAKFSHGLCPDCLRKLYPEQYRAWEREAQSGDATDVSETRLPDGQNKK